MDNETALKHLLNDIETRAEFASMEYECLFRKVEEQYQMGDTIRLLFDTKKVLLLSKKEFLSISGSTVLDKLINSISNLIEIDIIRLQDAEEKKRKLLVELCLKNERRERQKQSIYKTDKRIRYVDRQIRKNKRKLIAVERDIEAYSSKSPSVKLLILFRKLKEQGY